MLNKNIQTDSKSIQVYIAKYSTGKVYVHIKQFFLACATEVLVCFCYL